MKIYTKTGDKGTTSLFGGQRVDKNSTRIRAYGEVDELNSLIGVIVADFADYSSSKSEGRVEKSKMISSSLDFARDKLARTIKGVADVPKKLLRIQAELFVLGADLATPLEVKTKVPRVTKSFAARLEREIDQWIRELPQLKNFILPGGGKVGSKLHLARTVTRRVERSVVELSKQEKINDKCLVYVNRLSDWFFMFARYSNKLEKVREVVWLGRSKKSR